MEPEARFNHRERDILALELGVRSAQSANELSSPDLAPDQIVRVIHHLHLIGLGVPYPELDGVGSHMIWMRWYVRGETTT